MPRFSLGHIVMTRGVQTAIKRHPEEKGLEELVNVYTIFYHLPSNSSPVSSHQHTLDPSPDPLSFMAGTPAWYTVSQMLPGVAHRGQVLSQLRRQPDGGLATRMLHRPEG